MTLAGLFVCRLSGQSKREVCVSILFFFLITYNSTLKSELPCAIFKTADNSISAGGDR